jgi:DNA-directed RNA polymerase specialized sigma24 family protein
MVRKPKTEYYVNNKEFLEALVAYKFRVNRAKDAGDSRPIVPNYVGECFLKIATHLSYKPNFVNYMFREDMICDGIENCLQYIDNFNPEKSSNPFAYFTQIIYYAFLRRIQKEKRQLEIKSKILEKSGHQEIMHTDTYEGDMAGMNASYSDMGSIKENIETRMNR